MYDFFEEKKKWIEWEENFSHHNILVVRVGCSGLDGSGNAHGSIVRLTLRDECGTIMAAKSTTDTIGGRTKEISIELRGDAEIETFIEALHFASKKLDNFVHRNLI